jgi:type IV secretory pathway TrbD component
MVDRAKTARNIAIVLAIAGIVYFLPGAGRAADTFSAALRVVFTGGLTYWAVRLYRERRVGLYSLGDRHRALLYGALAAGVMMVAAKERMWQTGFGEFVWFVVVGLVVYTLFAVYRFARTY